MNTLFCKNRSEWRDWLQKNYNKESEVWLIYMKKHTKKQTVSYNDAVEEAICFGWIDSLIKRIDDDSYMQKYTPRKPKSVWSLVNKKRVEKMIRENKMTPAGIKLIEIAKENGQWAKAYSSKTKFKMPDKLLNALKENPEALKNFNNFPPSAKNNYIGYIISAKREDTIKRRIDTVVERSRKKLKPGLM